MTTRRKSAKKAKPAKKAKKAKKTESAKKAKPAKKKRAGIRRAPRAALKVAMSAKKPTKQRVKALAEVPLAVCESDENLQSMLKILRDENEPIKVRLATLQSLQAASFSVISFEACRADYLATLREIIDDPDLELRQRVMGILARENDGYVQQKLIEGLEDSEKALLPPEKALQLLSYDVHAEAYPVAREIVNNPPNSEAKRQALRILSADASSAPVFEKLMLDKKEDREIRQISAAALQAVRPKIFQERARQVVLDNKEYDDIQATALTALTQFGDKAEVKKDDTLLKRVDKLQKGKSAKVKKTAKRFLKRYRS